ncbi:MAG: MmgE/PrpD family protein [Chloroflexota bacterium]
MKPTETLAGYVAAARFDDFPPEVVLKAKQCILDAVGCALGAIPTDIARQTLEMAKLMGGSPEATLIGDGTRVPMVNAAYANAQVGNLLDYDDAVIPVPGHPGVAIIYPALAAAERTGATGKEIITAVILGYEVGLRVAYALRSVVFPEGASHPYLLFNTSYKILGAAAAAGKLLGLDKERLINAFGIAGGVVPGTAQPTWSPHTGDWGSIKANYGIYALLGTLAAFQAEKGLNAHQDILDSDEFWTRSGAAAFDYQALTRDLAKDYMVMHVGFKPVPSCRGTHPQLTAVMEALHGETVRPDDITEIALFGGRMLTRRKWDTMIEAEFSTACAVSLYLSGVEPGPDWYRNDRFKQPDITDLAGRIRFVEELRYWEDWVKFGKLTAAAEIKTKDGRVRKAFIEYPRGEPQNPMSGAELERKFVVNAAVVLGEANARKLYQKLIGLEDIPAAELMSSTFPA